MEITWTATSKYIKRSQTGGSILKSFVVSFIPIILAIGLVYFLLSFYSNTISSVLDMEMIDVSKTDDFLQIARYIIYAMVFSKIITIFWDFKRYQKRTYRLTDGGLDIQKGKKSVYYSWGDIENYQVKNSIRGGLKIFYLKKQFTTKPIIIYPSQDKVLEIESFLNQRFPKNN
jgi:hypothetical protein